MNALEKQFLENLYPDKNIKYVFVDPYIGKNSGLGYTLISSKHYLQDPFVFISCDTLILDKIPPLNHNWVGFSNISNGCVSGAP